MAKIDSLDKIFGSYFACVCAASFTYGGKEYHPKTLYVSPLLFRGFTCPPGCGACCPRFSLDYLPFENPPEELQLVSREINVNGKSFCVLSDMQLDHSNYHCRHLVAKSGRCGIYESRPFSCDFELIRFLHFRREDSKNMLTQKLYGRKHAMLRVDGARGTFCEMTPITVYTVEEVVRKLWRLSSWCDYFEITTKVPKIIQWAQTGPHAYPLIV